MISPKTGALALIILVIAYAVGLALWLSLSSCQAIRVIEGFRQFDTNRLPAHAKP